MIQLSRLPLSYCDNLNFIGSGASSTQDGFNKCCSDLAASQWQEKEEGTIEKETIGVAFDGKRRAVGGPHGFTCALSWVVEHGRTSPIVMQLLIGHIVDIFQLFRVEASQCSLRCTKTFIVPTERRQYDTLRSFLCSDRVCAAGKHHHERVCLICPISGTMTFAGSRKAPRWRRRIVRVLGCRSRNIAVSLTWVTECSASSNDHPNTESFVTRTKPPVHRAFQGNGRHPRPHWFVFALRTWVTCGLRRLTCPR